MGIACILVVEDNAVTRKMMRLALNADGYRVIEAERAVDALRLFTEEKPALVVSDLTLPDLDGFELFERLKRLDPDAHVPVLAMSGRMDDGRALELGFREYLMKPVAPARLVRAVHHHLAQGRTLNADRPGRRVMIVGGDRIEHDLRCGILRAQGFEVVGVRTGFEALTAAQRAKPDVIVSEIAMPEFNGLHLCWAVRTDPMLRQVPILLVGALEDEQAHARALGAGASAVLTDPRDLEALLAGVRRMIDRQSYGTELAATTTLPAGDEGRPITSRPPESPPSDRLLKAMPAFLSVISEVAERPRGVGRALDEILGVFLDASAFTSGVAFLESATGNLVLRAQVGHEDAARPHLGDYYGYLGFLAETVQKGDPLGFTSSSHRAEVRSLLAVAGMGSMLVIPLILFRQRLGVLVLTSPNEQLPAAWLEFVHGAIGQVTQAIDLARTASAISTSEQRFRTICEGASDGILVADFAGNVVYVNPAATALFGDAVEIGNQRVSSLLTFLDPDAGSTQRGDLLVSGRGTVPVQVSYRDHHDSNFDVRRVYVVCDLSDKLKIVELSHLATRDPLTGLFNRRRFEEELEVRLSEADRYGTKGLIVLIDLDKFKSVNDTYGHPCGDAMLRAVGDTLRRVTRESDVVARLGGDEFAVLLPHAGLSHGLLCAEKIRSRLAEQEVDIQGASIAIEASVGVAAFPENGLTQVGLFAAADAALYRAKRGGGNRVCMATPGTRGSNIPAISRRRTSEPRNEQRPSAAPIAPQSATDSCMATSTDAGDSRHTKLTASTEAKCTDGPPHRTELKLVVSGKDSERNS
jgi:diguanylate cyclase (GGDEF)-like protein